MKYTGFVKLIMYACAVFALVVLGLLFQETTIGITLILIYGVVAILRKVKSSQTFALMVVTLVYALIAHILSNELMAFNMVQYSFLLLCIGVICALLEERSEEIIK